jgi:hypothetical protein
MNAQLSIVAEQNLTPVERASRALSKEETEAELKALAEQSKAIVSVTDAASRKVAHDAMMVLKNMRIAIEKKAKEARDEANNYRTAVISIEKGLVQLIEPEESRLTEIRNEFDKAEEKAREARIQADLLRKEEIQRKIEAIRNLPVHATTVKESLILGQLCAKADSMVIDPAVYEEFTQSANEALTVSKAALSHLFAERKAQEARDEQAKKDAEELAALRAANAERDRLAAIETARKEAEAKAEAEKVAAAAKAQREAELAAQEEANRKERERIAAEEAAAKVIRDAEELRLKQEHDRQVAAARAHAQEIQRQREKDAKALELIGNIQNQVVLADGVAVVEAIDALIHETQDFDLTIEEFGAHLATAQKAKDATISALQRKRADLLAQLERQADEAAARLESERIARLRQEELDRQAEETRKANAAEEARLAAQRAEIEKQQAALAEAAKPKEAAKALHDGIPTRAQLVKVVAAGFGTSAETALGWLKVTNFKD